MKKLENKDIETVNNIIKKIVDEISNSRGEIVDIIDYARSEHQSIKKELKSIKQRAETIIEEVDTLEIKDKLMRKKLAKVSKHFNRYDEEEVKQVYDQALQIRTVYIQKKNDEKELITRRNQLEIALKKSIRTIESAEKAVNQISIAISYLKGEILSVLEDMDKESEMFFGIKILEAQENERKRISRDIHDGPAQYVANILMKAQITEKIIQVNMKEGLDELQELKDSIKLALKEIRSIIYDLRPMSLDDLGLNTTIEEFAKKFSIDNDIAVQIKIKPLKDEIESIIQVAVFRCIQEIFNNIKKHAKASTVQLQLDYGSKYLRVVIADDGVGFNVDETLEKVKKTNTSFGLVGIIERVEQLQGNIIINSSIGQGTAFNIKLPVSRKVIKDENRAN